MADKLINKYTLRSKDIPLIEFSLYKTKQEALGIISEAYYIKIDRTYYANKNLFPKSFFGVVNDDSLLKWIKRRKAPKNRHFVDKILSSFNDDNNPLRYVDISHALSLNDTYWITNNLTNDKWKDFNLYQHPFDEILRYVAFTGYSHKISGVIISPEVTSKGMLKKCWSNRKDGIYLIKGDDFLKREDGRSQITGEFYASQIAEVLELEYISYDLEAFYHKKGSDEIVCLCKLFTDEDIGFVDAYTYFKDNNITVDEIDPADLLTQSKLSSVYGVDAYADLMLFDSIIANQDRHYGNFGYLIDNNTGEYIKPAPIFDSGYSLLCTAAQQDLYDIDTDVNSVISCKYLPLNTQAMWFVEKRHLSKLRKLLNFKFKPHTKLGYVIDDKVVNILNVFIQNRARTIIDLYYKKQKDLQR